MNQAVSPALSPTVLITGAAGNLGRTVAAVFRGRGAQLVLVDRLADDLRRAFGAADERQLLVAADLLQPADAAHAVQEALQRWPRIDVLCNLAGGFRMGEAVHETSDETWNFLFDINLRTVLHMVRAAVPKMIEGGGGNIINVGAQSARQGLAGMGAYCAAKQAVVRLSEAMAAELASHRIRVNCVLPSVIDTPQNRAAMPEADTSRWVSPQEIAEAIAYLVSPAASGISGAAVPLGR